MSMRLDVHVVPPDPFVEILKKVQTLSEDAQEMVIAQAGAPEPIIAEAFKQALAAIVLAENRVPEYLEMCAHSFKTGSLTKSVAALAQLQNTIATLLQIIVAAEQSRLQPSLLFAQSSEITPED